MLLRLPRHVIPPARAYLMADCLSGRGLCSLWPGSPEFNFEVQR